MSFNIRIAFLALVLTGLNLIPFEGASQNGKFSVDSLFPSNISDTLNVKQYSFGNYVSGGSAGIYMLNALHGNHNYHPLYANSLVRNDLGNIGGPDYKSLFDYDQSFGFQFRSSRGESLKSLDDRKLLISEKMFSNVQYSNGVNQENYLLANFTRGFGNLVNIGFSFNRINSAGFYNRQINTITDISIYGTFKSKSERYKAIIMIDYLDLSAEENGGIANDSAFEGNSTSGRSFIPVNLDQSSNEWWGFDVGLEHRFFLLKEDSTSIGRKQYRPAISHSFSTARHNMVYRNVPDTSVLGFYENIYLDSTITDDSTNLLSISNVVRLELVKSDSVGDRALNRIAVGLQHDYHRISYDSSFVEQIHNLSVLGNVNGKLFKKLDWKASGNFMFYGYNIWDFKANGRFDYSVGRSNFSALLNYSLFRPDYITDNYVSNHFIWDNTWTQTQHLKAGLTYEQTRLRFKGTLSYHLLDNLIAFGVDRLPFQSNSVNQLVVLRLKEHFRMRWFHVTLDGALQVKLSGDDIRVPLALGRGMFYYQNDLFKHKLRLQVGVEASYSTAYYANGYNPALSEFHIQNKKQVGNYPFIDVFVNFRVKKFRAFFKIEHMNAGWFGNRYYHVPHYPANDLAWKFGVNWAFFD